MTTLSWDALGGDPTPGDPAAFDELARSFSETAENAGSAHGKLSRFAASVDDAIWSGEAADAFREAIGELPPRLEKLHASYGAAAEGMGDYARTLRELQDRARVLLGRAQVAQAEKISQERGRDRAQAADPMASAGVYDAAIAGAEARLRGVQREIEELRDQRVAAEHRALGRLEDAEALGIKNDPWYKRAFDAVDRFIDEHADILRAISGALKVISAIAGVLSFIPFLAPICGPIALIAGGLALLTDAALVATGNGDWKALLVDAALMALPGAGRLLGGALKGTRVGVTAGKTMRNVRSALPHALEVSGGARGALRNPRLFGRAAKCRFTGRDPVDMATGEMILQQDPDLVLPGLLSFTLQRTYRCFYRVGRWFGRSWSSTIEHRLEIDEQGVCYIADDGLLFAYPMPREGETVLPEDGPRLPLTRDADGYRITDHGAGQSFHFAVGIDIHGGRRPVLLPLAAITDRNRQRIDLDYDADGGLVAIRHCGGYHLDVDTQRGLIREIRLRMPAGEPDRVLIRYDYDEAGSLIGVVNSSGRALRFDYDERGRMAGWTDRNRTRYRYSYDDQDRCVATSGTGGCLDGTILYDKGERTTVETDSLGHATVYHFNDFLQIERVADPLGGVTRYSWDRYDRKLARTDPLGRTTRYDHDEAGNAVSVTRPDGSRVLTEYNDLGLPVRVIDPGGAVWERTYDGVGNLTALTDPMGATTIYAHDDRGHLTEVTDALGFLHRFETDAAGLVLSVTDPLGATTRYKRDPFGRVIEITDALGGVTCFEWTIEGKLVSRTLPDGATERWSYDAEGNLVEQIDALGQTTRIEIGPFDLPRSQTGPDGGRVEFVHDTELRLVAITNPRGLTWRYEYDAGGNLVAETDFNGRVLRSAHDAAGQLVERTDGAGEITRLTRDTLGAVVETRCGEAVTTFSYDAGGRLTRATNDDCDLTLEYDPLGRVLTERCNGATVTSSYDLLGRRAQRRTPSGAVSVWEYDANDRPSALHAGGRRLRFVHDELGREIQRHLGGSVAIAQSWDTGNRLASQTLTVSAPGSAEDPRPVQRRSYAYRAGGSVVGIDDLLSGWRRIDLDPVGRITAVGGPAWSERYAYDLAGNITFATWPEPAAAGATDALDARGERQYAGTLIRQAGKVRYEHDARGRVVLRQEKRLSEKPRTWRYTWGGDDRLTEVVTPDGRRWRYRYDPLGRRIAKERLAVAGEAVVEHLEFVWDGLVLAEQTHADVEDSDIQRSGGGCTTWDWEPGTFRPVAQTRRRWLPGVPQERFDQEFHAIVTDLAGTPTELVTPDGDIAWHQRSTAWGVPVPVPGETAGVECPLRFPGQYFDLETQSHYNFFRHYDPYPARYLTSDPVGLAFGLNSYTYATNPYSLSDPLGLGPYELARVGRWMSPKEHVAMVRTGEVQIGGGGTTHVAHPANPESYMRQAAPGSHYVEFDVPANSLRPAGSPDWAQIPSPEHLLGRIAAKRGTPVPSPVPASDIVHRATKLP